MSEIGPVTGGGDYTSTPRGVCIVRAMLDPATADQFVGGVYDTCDRYETTGPCGRMAIPEDDVHPLNRLPSDIGVLDFDESLCDEVLADADLREEVRLVKE